MLGHLPLIGGQVLHDYITEPYQSFLYEVKTEIISASLASTSPWIETISLHSFKAEKEVASRDSLGQNLT